MHERCKGHARASSYSVRVAGAAPNSSHETLRLASAVIAGCHKHPVRRQEPEQHPASAAVDAGADVDSIKAAPQRRARFMQRRYDVVDVTYVVEDVGRARARPGRQLRVPLDSDVRR